ncbi:Eukaryotic translation initiation factor 1A [Spraguea lophii 42_110]|uniref:Eukaryotic translation initiation factor 1A n=1 Tax=Spraguea lophii (strain 42_110) TaxID=1358809 RepID=S7WAD9_SPRLO|nr:Eukaryotic translation initiation factor 1A [Spraguea lophii 42_110]
MAKNKSKRKQNVPTTLEYSEEGVSIYGQVLKPLGSCRFKVSCSDSIIRVCKARGSFHRRVWINESDIVLLVFREGEPNKGDIVRKYLPYEVKVLRDSKEIPENFNREETVTNFEFETI